MKVTDMAKKDAKKMMGKLGAPHGAGFGGNAPVAIDRREQRKRDQALGLVPFAVKLNAALVQTLQAMAKDRDVAINDLVAEVLAKGLAA